MSITKIKDIYLCTGLYEDNNENRKSYDWLKANNIEFTHLSYWDPVQHADLFANYSTWIPGLVVDKFPFVHYTEVTDDSINKPVFLIGYDALVSSNLIELIQL